MLEEKEVGDTLKATPGADVWRGVTRSVCRDESEEVKGLEVIASNLVDPAIIYLGVKGNRNE